MKSLGFLLVFVCLNAVSAAGQPPIAPRSTRPIEWQAQWIALPGVRDDTNLWMLARRVWTVQGNVRHARVAVTADTKYQLFINGSWVSDGPVRAYPEHYRYDEVEVARFLRPGPNVIGVRLHHWGRDTGQNVAVRPGLLVQLEWADEAGAHTLGSDRTWQVRVDEAYNPRSGAVSPNLGFEEQYDARREATGWLGAEFTAADWQKAEEIAAVTGAPWKDLQRREIPQMTKEPFRVAAVLDAQRVRAPRIVSCVNLGRKQGLDRKEQALNAYRFVLVTEIVSETDQEAVLGRPTVWFEFGKYRLGEREIDVAKDLIEPERVRVSLRRGANPLVVVLDGRSLTEEFQFILDAEAPIALRNPFGAGSWAVAGPFPANDADWKELSAAKSLAAVEAKRGRFRAPDAREIVDPDVHGLTSFRRVLGPARISGRQNLVFQNEEVTTIPAGEEDIELMIDLGQEYNAHLGIELQAPPGVILDGNIFERFHEGAPQWSWRNRCSFRYVTRGGWQDYLTAYHYGGRYLALTVRARPADVRIRRVFGVWSHYPAADRGAFHSSNELLNSVWRISRQTMLACMEDTFVDCPLYEQSYWLGDARNEALVCYLMFGETDLVRRGCLLGAQSLERGDLVAMRAPTRWNQVIPAWSFLWARMCWEHAWYSGDQATLVQEYYPAVRKMLNTILERHLDPETGLFSIQAWQFFDWVKGLDTAHRRATHNNTFLVDTLRLGVGMAEIAQDGASARRFAQAADQLTAAINRHLWDETRGAYLDALHNDGKRSPSVSRQINTLALLHGVVPSERQTRLLPIVLGEKTENVVQFGSPFATLYLLEYLGETGRTEAMLEIIRQSWGGMMDRQTTTFWESFASGNLGGGRYPTRSYCHAWSAGPAYVFGRYILGIRPTAPGFRTFEVAPQPGQLGSAEGVVPTGLGEIQTSWRRSGGQFELSVVVPEGAVATIRLPGNPERVEWKGRQVDAAGLKLVPGKHTVVAR